MKRRQAIAITLAGGAMTGVSSSAESPVAKLPPLKKNDVILFQGDSITDAGRSRETQDISNKSETLGQGYAAMIGPQLLASHPELDLKIYNRGISGNKITDLQDRWQKDALDLKPALISILIGVNDIWRKFDSGYLGTVEDYETGLAHLLESTRRDLPGVRLVVCQPFVLKCGVINDQWFPEFTERIAAARRAASKANAVWVPFQDAFDEALAAHPDVGPQYWANDGVHPSLAGHALMAATWRKAVRI